MSTSDCYSDTLPDVLDFGSGATIDRDYFMWVVTRMVNRRSFPLWDRNELTSAAVDAAYQLASKWDPERSSFPTLLGNYLWQLVTRLYHAEMLGYSDTTLAAWRRKGWQVPYTEPMSSLDDEDDRFIDTIEAPSDQGCRHYMAWVLDDLEWMTESVRRVVMSHLWQGSPLYGGTAVWIRKNFDNLEM